MSDRSSSPDNCPKSPAPLQSYQECLARLCAAATPRPPATRSLAGAVGQVLAEDLVAPISVPSFDNSAMDGFAFAAAATAAATPEAPVRLPVAGASIAGAAQGPGVLKKGTAARIMTGAPLPEGADTILPVEAAGWDHEELHFDVPYAAGRHVRRQGEDIAAGSPLLRASVRIAPQHLPLLSAVGQARLPVRPAPRAVWISTGQELSDDFDRPLAPGQIYNATRLYGQTMAGELGLEIIDAVTVRDTPEDFAAALDRAFADIPDSPAEEIPTDGPQIILSTGGVSAGQYDFVRPVLEQRGATIIFHKARIKPAKPVLFARLAGGAFFFGLPGNPVSTALALRVFVAPFVRRLTGRPPEGDLKARLAEDCRTAGDKTVFLMGRVAPDATGRLLATPQTGQNSFQTAAFAASNAWIIVPEGRDSLAAGSVVTWIPFRPPDLP